MQMARNPYGFTPNHLSMMASATLTEISALIDFVIDLSMDTKYKISPKLIDGLFTLNANLMAIPSSGIDITNGDHYEYIELIDNFLIDYYDIIQKNLSNPVVFILNLHLQKALYDLVDVIDHFYVLPPI